MSVQYLFNIMVYNRDMSLAATIVSFVIVSLKKIDAQTICLHAQVGMCFISISHAISILIWGL